MSIPISSKLPKVGTTIFAVMSKMAQDHGAINLSQGFPDFEPDPVLLERVTYHLQSGKNQYPPTIGVPALREAIAKKLATHSSVSVDPESQITITSGATEALFCAIHSVVKAGDEVIVFDPAYDSYGPAIALAGGKAIHVPLSLPGYSIDWETVEKAFSRRTRLVIVNNPHNPTGSILRGTDLKQLANLIEQHNCYLISDEVYEHLVFDGQKHRSALTHPILSKRTFTVFSFGKTYHATGWKVGYCVAPAALSVEFRKVHQFNAFTTVTPMQWALADFMESNPQNYLALSAFYQQKRDLFGSLLSQSRFKLLPSDGTYFQLADYSAISNKSDTEFASWMTQEKGVAVIPLSPFYQNPPNSKIVRFCFAKQDQTLREAAKIICQI